MLPSFSLDHSRGTYQVTETELKLRLQNVFMKALQGAASSTCHTCKKIKFDMFASIFFILSFMCPANLNGDIKSLKSDGTWSERKW